MLIRASHSGYSRCKITKKIFDFQIFLPIIAIFLQNVKIWRTLL